MQCNGAQLSVARGASVSRLFRTEAESRVAGSGFPQTATAHGWRLVGPLTDGHKALRLHDVLEEEAKRIAQSLHDEAGQLLAAVFLKLDELNRKVPESQRSCVQELKSSLDLMEEQLRRISHELRPTMLDDLGLLPAVEFLRHGVAKRTGLSIVVEGSIPVRVPPILATTLYRIIREALGIIASHARASRVRIAFRMDHDIHCTIHDDGIGFDPAGSLAGKTERGRALTAIRERVEGLSGTLSIQSGPGRGTKLVVSIPL